MRATALVPIDIDPVVARDVEHVRGEARPRHVLGAGTVDLDQDLLRAVLGQRAVRAHAAEVPQQAREHTRHQGLEGRVVARGHTQHQFGFLVRHR